MTSTFKERRLFSADRIIWSTGAMWTCRQDHLVRTPASASDDPLVLAPHVAVRGIDVVTPRSTANRITSGSRVVIAPNPTVPTWNPVFPAAAFRACPETGSSRPKRPAEPGERRSRRDTGRRAHHPKEIPSSRSGSHPASLLIIPRVTVDRAPERAHLLHFGGGERPRSTAARFSRSWAMVRGPVSTTSTCGLARQKR